MLVGIFGQAWEPEVQSVQARLDARGVQHALVDLAGFPRTTRLEVRLESDEPQFLVDGAPSPPADAWYLRVFGFTDPLLKEPVSKEAWADMHDQHREWVAVQNQKQMFVASMLALIHERAPCVNPPVAFTEHTRKPWQVHKLQQAGLPVPPFVISNDPDGVRAFLARHPRTIYKPVAGGRHTREIDRPLFDERAHALHTEPILVQALAEGRHCRAYVAGGRFVGAAEILFDKEARMDYRASSRGAERVDLPAAIRAQCVQAAEAVGMPFTGLDVIWDEDAGTHAFLECNPSPMFANFERMTGVPVADALADLLVETAKGGP